MNYKEHFNNYWIPILKKQYFKFRLMNYDMAILELEKNIMKNWNLSEKEKKKIIRKIKGVKSCNK